MDFKSIPRSLQVSLFYDKQCCMLKLNIRATTDTACYTGLPPASSTGIARVDGNNILMVFCHSS